MGFLIPLENIIMVSRIISVVVVAALYSHGQAVTASQVSTAERAEKHFSLFSVVTFKNEECTSSSSITGGAVEGTCYTSTECSDNGGTKSGNCASGFGVCCVFIDTSGATKTITENRTRLRNSEYPSYATATAKTSIVYTIKKASTDVCQLRLDFTKFVVAGPLNSLEDNDSATSYNHICTNDNLVIATTATTASTGYGNIPTLCGILTAQHLYIELSPTHTDYATLTLTTSFTTANQPTPAIAKRLWDIKTSQIECYASYRAPHGCDRWFTTDYGKITSFNFYKVSGSSFTTSTGQNSGLELMSQNLNTCIRRSKGMCCVQYDVCIVDTQGIALEDEVGTTDTDTGIQGTYNEGFSVSTNIGETDGWPQDEYANFGAFDALCSQDYVEIPSSHSGRCGGTGTANVNSRYCGAKFGANLVYTVATGALYQSPGVCDCSEPFSVRHGSDQASDIGGDDGVGTGSTNLAVTSRGFCLDYLQLPCSA